MRHALILLAGLVVGALAGAAVVYYNPLTANRSPPPVTADWQLDYALPEPGLLMHTHGGDLPLARRPADVPELWEETIRSSLVTTLELVDGRDGGAAWATRISVPSTKTNLVLNGVVIDDYWLISAPDAGSLFVATNTNLWPALKDTYLRVDVLGRPWQGPTAYSPTLRSADSPVVFGATGRFAEATGRGIETFEITSYDAEGGLEGLTGRLSLVFDEPKPFADGR